MTKRKPCAMAAVALALCLIASQAFAASVDVTAGAVYSAPDSDAIDNAIGAQVAIGAPVDDLWGVQLVLQQINADLADGGCEIGVLESTTVDGIVTYRGLPAWGKVQPYAFGGFGIGIPQIKLNHRGSAEADKGLRLLGGLGWDWLVYQAQDGAKMPVDVTAFAKAGYVLSDNEVMVGRHTETLDTDALEVASGFKASIKF